MFRFEVDLANTQHQPKIAPWRREVYKIIIQNYNKSFLVVQKSICSRNEGALNLFLHTMA